jgi:hypothetical protein
VVPAYVSCLYYLCFVCPIGVTLGSRVQLTLVDTIGHHTSLLPPPTGSSLPCKVNGQYVCNSLQSMGGGAYVVTWVVTTSSDLEWPWVGLSVDIALIDRNGNVSRLTLQAPPLLVVWQAGARGCKRAKSFHSSCAWVNWPCG